MRPRKCSEKELRKVGVEIAERNTMLLQCARCSTAWQPMIRPGGKLPRGYWKCPKGCNEQ